MGSYGYRCKLSGSKQPERVAGLSPPSSTEITLRGATPLISKYLRRITNIKWTNKITNEELWRITHPKSIDNRIKSRKWNWIGHTLRKETEAIEKTALDWNPQGYRRRGRPKRTWRRAIEDEIRSTRRSRNEIKGIAEDRNAWKLFMDALCSTRNKRIWWWFLHKHNPLWKPVGFSELLVHLVTF